MKGKLIACALIMSAMSISVSTVVNAGGVMSLAKSHSLGHDALIKSIERRNYGEVAKYLEKYPNAVNYSSKEREKYLSRYPDMIIDDPKPCLGTPLFAAAEAGDIKILKLLIKKGANVHKSDDEGNTVLHYAIANHYRSHLVKVAKILIDNGASLNKQNKHGETPVDCLSKRDPEKIKVVTSHLTKQLKKIIASAVQNRDEINLNNNNN